MPNLSLRLLFAHLLFLLDGLQRSFWNYVPQPLLSAIFPLLLEAGPKPSPIAHVPQVHDLPNYINLVDLSTMCLLTIFQTPSTMNLTCSVDHSDHDQDDVSPVEPEHLHLYVSLDSIPVQGEDKSSPLPQSEQAEPDHAQNNLASYGARGLSFCPVLVGVTYLHSLLHLYMLLMIPSLVNHWFEDVSFYESLNPTVLSGYSLLLHTSLLMAPWYLVRYGFRRVLPCLYRSLRRVTYRPAQPSIPRIVLIRVDGQAVPVHFVEDHQARADVDDRLAFESEDLETRNNRDEASDCGDADVVQFDVSDDDSFTATEFNALPVSTLSQQGDSQGGISNSHDPIGPGPLILDVFTKDSQHVVNPSDEQWETFSHPFRTGNEQIEELDDFGQVASPDGVVNDDPRDDTNCIVERESSNQDVDSSSWSLVDDRGLYETEMSPASLSTISSSVESQDTITPAKNARFTDVDGTDDWQTISSPTRIEYIDPGYVWDLGSLFGADDDTPIGITAAPWDSLVKAKLLTQVTATAQILQEGSDIDQHGNDVTFEESLSPFLTGKPVVNLPGLVLAREETEAVDMDATVYAVPMEDVATRSPLQMLSLNVPAVVISTNCSIEADKEQSLTMGGELALDQEESRNEEAEAGMNSGFASPREYGSRPANLSIEDPRPICSPIIDSKSPVGDVRLVGSALSALPPVSETGFPLAHAGLVVTDPSPSDSIDVHRTNEIEAEVVYETPRLDGLLDAKDPPRSPRYDLQGLETIHLEATVANSLVEPGTEYIISGQSLDFSCTVAIGPTMPPPGRALRSPNTQEGIILLSTTSVEKKNDELHHGKSHKDDIAPWDLLATTSQPWPQRTPSGSVHASLGQESLSPLQKHSNIDLASVLCESFPSAGSKDSKGTTTTKNASKRAQDIFASIHAPKKVSQPEAPSLDSDPRKGGSCDRCRSVTGPVSEGEPSTKPVSPNWAAMPEVVDAFRTFKQPHSGNGIRRASSVSECISRGLMTGIVGQKGLATNSLNNTSTIANIQGRWMRGGGLLLVRDLVSSDPADFNLRTCTNSRSSKIHCMTALPMQLSLHPGQFNISPLVSQHKMTCHPIGVEADNSKAC